MPTQPKKYIQFVFYFVCFFLLSACSGFFDKDNTPEPTPLTNIKPDLTIERLWAIRTGVGSQDEYLKMTPAIGESSIFTTSSNGVVTAVNKSNGQIRWQVATKLPIAAGPSLNNQLLIVSSRKGDVLALRAETGAKRWKTNVTGEILAKAAIGDGVVLIKTTDGYLRALSVEDGHSLWSYRQVEPNLILRGASAPVIKDDRIIVGFANGNLAKLSLENKQLIWLQTIAIPEGAFAVQRMIDIDADPLLLNHHIYAATYQGKVASLDWTSGRILWNHDISSYTGMAVDDQTLFVTDAKSLLWAFNSGDGVVNWQQDQLKARTITAPAIMDNNIVVGDGLGYLHWMSKQDGHFVAREFVGSPIYASPIVSDRIVYVFTSNGYLAAYAQK